MRTTPQPSNAHGWCKPCNMSVPNSVVCPWCWGPTTDGGTEITNAAIAPLASGKGCRNGTPSPSMSRTPGQRVRNPGNFRPHPHLIAHTRMTACWTRDPLARVTSPGEEDMLHPGFVPSTLRRCTPLFESAAKEVQTECSGPGQGIGNQKSNKMCLWRY